MPAKKPASPHSLKSDLPRVDAHRVKKSEYEEDLGKANPFHIIAVALVAVGLFVVGLITLVNWVVKN